MSADGVESSLKELGLSTYEAKALVALLKIGAGSPRGVASLARIPYPSAYDALRSLALRGWVDVARARPAIYRARPPSFIKGEVLPRLEDLFQNLEKLYQSLAKERMEILYTILRRDRVLAKIKEMLAGSKRYAIAAFPSRLLQESGIEELFDTLAAKRVSVRLMTDREVPRDRYRSAEIRLRSSVHAVDLLVDGRQALISLADLSACGWIESPGIALHFQEFLELLWRDSKPL